MSLVETLVGRAPRVIIGDVSVDASIAEVHNREADITEHPVESGADITDHYRARPKTIQIEALVTNTPIATGYPGQTAINSLSALSLGDDPVLNAWSAVNEYFKNAEIIDIETSLQLYKNVGLTSFSVTRDSKNGQNLRFSCTAKELIVVTTEEAEAITIPETSTAGKAGGAASKGKKPPAPANAEQSKSAAAKLLDKGLGFFS